MTVRLLDNPRRRVGLPLWLDRIGVANALATAVLVIAAIGLVADQSGRGGPMAYPLVVLAVLPLLWMRRFPAQAPIAVALVTLFAQLSVGPLVTCGVVVPTVFIMAFQLGSRPTSNGRLALGGAGLAVTGIVEVVLDPALQTTGAAVFIFGLATTFFVGGLMIRSRVRMADDLRRRTIDLAVQRDRTAALAVEADRARIGADLDLTIRSRVAGIARAVEIARAANADLASPHPASSPELLIAALVEIEHDGRETLADMRAVVGTLREPPTTPPPGVADLPGLIRRATTSEVRLRVDGAPRALASNVELCVYRIVERLLGTMSGDPAARVEVVLRFSAERLDLRIDGPVGGGGLQHTDPASATAALHAARARAEILGGRLDVQTRQGRRRVQVAIPVSAPNG